MVCARVLAAALFGVMLAAGLLWHNLGAVLQAVVNSECTSPHCAKLRVGLDMAGGDVAGMADALRAKAWATLLGPKPTKTRTAWRRLLKVLSDVDRQYLSQQGLYGLGSDGDTEIAEGFRMVTHLTRSAFEIFLEGGSADRPQFTRLVSPTVKVQGDNPDAHYYIAAIDDAHAYRVYGRKHPDSVYMSITSHAHPPGEAMEKATAVVNHHSLNFGVVDGDPLSYCVDLFPAGAGPQHPRRDSRCSLMLLPTHTVSVVTRHYWEMPGPAALNDTLVDFLTAALRIEMLEGVDGGAAQPVPSSPMGDDELAGKLALATKYIYDHSIGMPPFDPATAPAFFSLMPNVIGKATKHSTDVEGMGALDIAYAGGPFALKPGQGLLLEGRLPKVAFMNCLLWNRFLQTLDYEHRQTSLNRVQLRHGVSMQSYRILVTDQAALLELQNGGGALPQDFDVLDTEGRARGTVFFRFILPEDSVEQPAATLVDVRTMMPVEAAGAEDVTQGKGSHEL